MDIQSLLNNETVKNALEKLGVGEDKYEQIVEQASNAIKSKASEDPKKMSSLMSKNPNSDDDNMFQNLIQNDFVQNLISKVGLSEDQAKGASNILPDIVGNFDIGSIADKIGDFFDGDDNSSTTNQESAKSSGGIGGILKKLFGK